MKKVSWGEDPEENGPRNFYRETLIIQSLQRRVKEGIVLDAGCGNGKLTRRIAKAGYNVEGVDTSKQSIDFLNKKAKQLSIDKKLHAQVGSIFKLPFKKDYFDGVVCGEVLEHLKEDEKAIKELFRVLKRNGCCVVTVPAKMEKWDSVDDVSGHIRRYTKEELREKFEKAGFTVLTSKYWGFPLTNYWHDFIYRPFLERKMNTGYKVTNSEGVFAKIVKNEHIVTISSLVFHIDTLFDITGLGNSLILVAVKK
ncbi:MAG TPA: class I SAM-dependent methyltransferase [Candidatus Saccharimonadales bacterium]|nr:class I SAM-dependent methyltransferase [Candidatus Saccharimonadales bacterium]